MAVNDLSFNQVSAFLNAVQHQVTGVSNPAPADTKDFVAVATTLLKQGYDPILNAVNQVLARTIFSIRPYSAKFRLAEIPETAYGNHTRKLSIADKDIVDDDRYKYPVAFDSTQNPANGDGQSVDMFTIRKPEILQTNFYGSNVWQDYYTLFKDQMECAFKSPADMGRFVTMITTNSSNKLTQYREDTGRATVLNFIGGVLDENDAATSPYALGHRVIPLITLYNAFTGENVTIADCFNADNMRPFTQFVYATIKSVSNMMTERSIAFQTIINGKNVQRHTPKAQQKMFILEQMVGFFEAMGIANTYHDGYITMGGVRAEPVGFWQSIKDPYKIQVNASRVGTDGSVVTGTMDAAKPVIAVLFDEEALGYATTQAWQAPTPLNARGGYWNMWIHETEKVYNDHSEKGVVFTLE